MSYRREDISNAIWDDEDFDRLSNDAALLYLWSFTNPRCGMAGVYRVKRRHLCEGRFSGDALETALNEVQASKHMFFTDGYVWVRTRVKHLRTKGPSMLASIKKDVLALPPGHPFLAGFCSEYELIWPDLVAEIEAQAEGGHKEPPEGVSGGSEGVRETA